jgi:hypothetical protein
MRCADCSVVLHQQTEKAIADGQLATVWADDTGAWVCRVTGNEHRAVESLAGSGSDEVDQAKRLLHAIADDATWAAVLDRQAEGAVWRLDPVHRDVVALTAKDSPSRALVVVYVERGDFEADEERLFMEPCLDAGPDCAGAVAYRMALSGTGQSYARCDKHWNDRLDVQADSIPDTPNPPSWFDPTIAGETWDEDSW